MLKRWAAWPQGIRWLGAIAVVVLALAVVWALFVPLADWLARHDVGSVKGALHETALDNARGRLLTLGAGLFAAGALVFTARNFTVSRRTLELTEQGQVTDRYTKAIEQLGSDKLDVRIGGIYALERVARDSARDHPTVMEVLTAFIREHSREPWPEPNPGGQEQEQSIRPDVQAAITVVGRRDRARDVQRINLSRANLAGADLIGADLTQAVLSGATLTRANLIFATLTRADLTQAVLSDATLTRAVLSGANLSGADLTRADLTQAVLSDANLARAVLIGAVLSAANLSAANLSAAVLSDAVLSDAVLARADLIGADLSDADLARADLSDAVLARAVLTDANWPEGEAVPRGWKRDPNSGRLRQEN